MDELHLFLQILRHIAFPGARPLVTDRREELVSTTARVRSHRNLTQIHTRNLTRLVLASITHVRDTLHLIITILCILTSFTQTLSCKNDKAYAQNKAEQPQMYPFTNDQRKYNVRIIS